MVFQNGITAMVIRKTARDVQEALFIFLQFIKGLL